MGTIISYDSSPSFFKMNFILNNQIYNSTLIFKKSESESICSKRTQFNNEFDFIHQMIRLIAKIYLFIFL